MSYVCGECGEVHDDASRYFMWRRPHLTKWDRARLCYDDRSTCRIPGRRYFIQCELELPFRSNEEKPLGFIGWAEVSRAAYHAYRRFRRSRVEQFWRRMVVGKLANPIPAVPHSIGTRVRFDALRDDPTPYIRWVVPGSSLANRVREGATFAFWHEAIDWLQDAP